MIRFWLNSVEQGISDTKPFRDHFQDNTRVRYAKLWLRLVLFCLRTLDDEEKYGVQFTTELKECLQRLRGLLYIHDDMNNTRAICRKVSELSCLLIMHSDYDKKFSVLKYFSGILGYNVDCGRWKKPSKYTPTIAQLLFCIKVIGLEYCLPQDERDNFRVTLDDNPHIRLNKFRDQWLVENQPSPFNYLHKLLNYGIYAAKDATGADNIRICPDKKLLYYGTQQLDIQAWKGFQKDILRQAESILSRQLLFRQSDIVETINPYSFDRDDQDISDVDHYFAEKIPNFRKNGRSMIIDNLRLTCKWNDMVTINPDGIEWNQRGVGQYHRDRELFLELILLSMNFTCGETGRGQEILSIQYKNSMDKDRNILIDDGQIQIATEYHKSQAIMDDLKVSLVCCQLRCRASQGSLIPG
jgi:hypothetical protein